MLVRVDPQAAEPLFSQVAGSIRVEAAAGRLSRGERLPPARELATALEVNVHTVLRAYQQLRDEGLVQLRRGRGAVLTAAVDDLADLLRGSRKLAARAHELGVSADALVALVRDAVHELDETASPDTSQEGHQP